MSKDSPPIEVIDQEETPAEAEARRREQKLYEEQRTLLHQLLQDKVLPSWSVIVMIKLGIITMIEDPLPCDEPARMNTWYEHDDSLKEYLERKRNPVPAPEGPRPSLADWESFRAYQQQERAHRNEPPSTHVACPIQTLAFEEDEGPVSCVRARLSQRLSSGYRDNPEKCQELDDPADPVNATQLRPCLVLGRALRDTIFYPINRDRQAAEERRWAGGKPQA